MNIIVRKCWNKFYIFISKICLQKWLKVMSVLNTYTNSIFKRNTIQDGGCYWGKSVSNCWKFYTQTIKRVPYSLIWLAEWPFTSSTSAFPVISKKIVQIISSRTFKMSGYIIHEATFCSWCGEEYHQVDSRNLPSKIVSFFQFIVTRANNIIPNNCPIDTPLALTFYCSK